MAKARTGARASEETLRAIERSTERITTVARGRLTETFPWFARLPAEQRSWVGLIAQAAISAFIRWYRADRKLARVTSDVFGVAPPELAGSITLAQTVDLMRCVVEVVEAQVVDLAPPREQAALHLAVVDYSREVAFAAAHVYAKAAETRGAWDARLESLVVDAVLRGEHDDEITSRATALGWGERGSVVVVVGPTPRRPDAAVHALRGAAARAQAETLIAVQGRRLVVVLGGREEIWEVVTPLARYFGEGPVVVGPTVPHLFAAGRSARAALVGQRAAVGCPDLSRPVLADDLLPERVLLGDVPARHLLVERIHRPLVQAGTSLLETAVAYLGTGRGVESTARELFVHANTVRYRLGRIADVTGYDLTRPREAYVVEVALAVGRLTDAGVRPWRRDADKDSYLGGTLQLDP